MKISKAPKLWQLNLRIIFDGRQYQHTHDTIYDIRKIKSAPNNANFVINDCFKSTNFVINEERFLENIIVGQN